MTMLTYTRGAFEPARYSSARQDGAEAGAAAADLAMIKRVCMCALGMLAVGGAATAVVALRAALYFWRFHY